MEAKQADPLANVTIGGEKPELHSFGSCWHIQAPRAYGSYALQADGSWESHLSRQNFDSREDAIAFCLAHADPPAAPAGCGWRIQDAEKTGWPYELAQEICEWARCELKRFDSHFAELHLGYVPLTRLIVEFLENRKILPSDGWRPVATDAEEVRRQLARVRDVLAAEQQNGNLLADALEEAKTNLAAANERLARHPLKNGWGKNQLTINQLVDKLSACKDTDEFCDVIDAEFLYGAHGDWFTTDCPPHTLLKDIRGLVWACLKKSSESQNARLTAELEETHCHLIAERRLREEGDKEIARLTAELEEAQSDAVAMQSRAEAAESDMRVTESELSALKSQQPQIIPGGPGVVLGYGWWGVFAKYPGNDWAKSKSGWIWSGQREDGDMLANDEIAFRLPSPAPEGKAEDQMDLQEHRDALREKGKSITLAEFAAKHGLNDSAVDGKAEPLYPCADCGKPLTRAEGGTTFTVCEACWKRHPPKAEELNRTVSAINKEGQSFTHPDAVHGPNGDIVFRWPGGHDYRVWTDMSVEYLRWEGGTLKERRTILPPFVDEEVGVAEAHRGPESKAEPAQEAAKRLKELKTIRELVARRGEFGLKASLELLDILIAEREGK